MLWCYWLVKVLSGPNYLEFHRNFQLEPYTPFHTKILDPPPDVIRILFWYLFSTQLRRWPNYLIVTLCFFLIFSYNFDDRTLQRHSPQIQRHVLWVRLIFSLFSHWTLLLKLLYIFYKTRMHSSRMHTVRSSSRPGGSPPGTPPEQAPPRSGTQLDQAPPRTRHPPRAGTSLGPGTPLGRSPSTSPLAEGLNQIPLHFPFGCGPGDPPHWRPAARHTGMTPAMHAGIAPLLWRNTHL